jgi:hypothetical protein
MRIKILGVLIKINVAWQGHFGRISVPIAHIIIIRDAKARKIKVPILIKIPVSISVLPDQFNPFLGELISDQGILINALTLDILDD